MSFTATPFEDEHYPPTTRDPTVTSSISFQPLSKFFRPSVSIASRQTLHSESSHTDIPESTASRHEFQDAVGQEKFIKFITSWRRATIEDKPVIEELAQMTPGNFSQRLFRENSLDDLIDKSYFSIAQLNARGEVIAFTAYNTYPDIICLSEYWTEWIETHYSIKNVSPRSVLFIHYMVWDPQRENEFLRHLLYESFTQFIHLKQIIILKPPKVRIPNCYKQYFVPVFPFGMENYEHDSVQSLLICLRATIIPPFLIRTAFQEDLEKTKVVLSKLRGLTKEQTDYVAHIKDTSEFLYREDKRIVVCEKNGELVGVMVLNLIVDLDVLNKEFELLPFNGLKKKGSQEINVAEYLSPSRISSIKNRDHTNLFLSSDFFFDHVNWELSSEKSSDWNSNRETLMSQSFSLDTNFWQFSGMQSFSNVETCETSETPSNVTTSVRCKSSSPSTKEYKLPLQNSFCKMTHFFSPMYDGPQNCFTIDFLLADTRKVDEKLVSLDLLRAAFEVVGDKDYCLLIIPSHFLPDRLQEFFVRVTPKLPSNTTLQLYLCHKNTLPDTEVFVRSPEESDFTSLLNFLKHVDDGETIYGDVTKALADEENLFKCYLLLAEKEIVGVSVLDSRDYQKTFYDYFDLGRHVPEVDIFEDQLLLKHLIVQPTYHCHTRFFMQEIMKLSSVSCIYYAINFPNQDSYSLVTVLEEFSPIKTRKMLPKDTYTFTKERKNHPGPFSLYFLTDKACIYNKIHVNIFIVVVGASTTALAFLENLVFGPASVHVQYNNLICVTPHALESIQTQGSEIIDLMFPIRDEISRNYSFMLSLKTYVSFVYGAMTSINRSEKYITVNNKTVIKYDYLILTCGSQYFMPIPTAKQVEKKKCQRRYTGGLAKYLANPEPQEIKISKKPSNLFLINTNWDAKSALRGLQNLINKWKKSEKKIIVYGHNIDVFLTIHTLMKLGVPGEVIVFVEPFLPDNGEVTVFNDFSVDQAVLDSLEKSKVNYYTRYFLYDWYTEDDLITSVVFHSKTKALEVPCLAFFPFDQKMVSTVTQRACLDAGLIYDGRLVINHNFRTNDKNIYAAGPFTRYARKYFASDKDHHFYNSREVGLKLAHIIRRQVDPFTEYSVEKQSMLVPQLSEPLTYHCQLPGDFNFFVMRKPGKVVDLETAYNLKDYGDVLYTGDCQMKRGFGYFRLHLNPEGFVESITCYTKDKIDYVNLISLYGLHETLLNNLLSRYDLSLISDFFQYFRQPWAGVIFHEDFKYLRELNLKALKKKLKDGSSINDKASEIIKSSEWGPLPTNTIKALERQFENSAVKKEIENNLLGFLERFSDDLPMYATSKSLQFKQSNLMES